VSDGLAPHASPPLTPRVLHPDGPGGLEGFRQNAPISLAA
jgi:hypothetical protein